MNAMRSTGSSVLVVVLLSACSRPNPLFADGEGGEGEVQGEVTSGEVTSGEVTTSGPVTSGEVGDATRTTSADASAEGPVTTDASATTEVAVDSGVLDTGLGCEPMFAEPFGIVAEPSLESVIGGCPSVAFLTVGVETHNGGDVTGVLCNDMCTCTEMPISLSFDAPVPAGLSGCFELALELDGDCNVLAYTIVTSAGPPPRVVVSNVVDSTLMHPFFVSLGPEPFEVCGEGCEPDASGYYPLVLPDGTEVLPGNIGVVPGPAPYAFTNAGSGIDAGCEPVARWHAVLD